MPKMKTHKGAAGRFKITGTGKIKRNRSGRRHLLSNKSGNKRRKMRGVAHVDKSNLKMITRMILGR